MSMIISLSVFNGYDDLFTRLFSKFDPDIKISAVEGKTFSLDSIPYEQIQRIEGVNAIAVIVEENALFRYRDKEYIASIKGVSDNYSKTNDIDSLMVEGKFQLHDQYNQDFAIVGRGVQHALDIRLNFTNPIHVFVPKRTGTVSANPEQAFKKDYLFPSGVFKIELEYDAKYVMLPIGFARKLLEYENEVTSLELNLKEGYKVNRVQNEIKALLGSGYKAQDRFQQNESLYRIFKTEKSAVFIILTFILIIFSFNLIGTLTMLILEKKSNIETLKNIGAGQTLIDRIFLYEGWLISIIGGVLGLLLGFVLCWIQIHFGIIKLSGGSYIVDQYPVALEFGDFVLTFFTVVFLGWLSAFIPVRFIRKGQF